MKCKLQGGESQITKIVCRPTAIKENPGLGYSTKP